MIDSAEQPAISTYSHFSAWKVSLACFLILRIAASGWCIALSHLFPSGIDPATPFEDPHILIENSISTINHLFLLPWYRWDTVHYIQIALTGYPSNPQNVVWPPLYPGLIRIFSLIIRNPLLSSLIISNLAALIAFYLLYKLVATFWDENTAVQALVLLIIFPAAFFLVAGYTESLFLALALGMFLEAQAKRWETAGILSALAALTRIQGFLLCIPLIWFIFMWWRSTPKPSLFQLTRAVSASLLGPLALAAFSAYTYFFLHVGWPWQSLDAWGLHFDWPWTGFIGNLTGLIIPPLTKQIPLAVTLFDPMLGIVVVIFLIVGAKRLPAAFQLYGWVIFLPGIMKVTSDHFLVSTTRYALIIFPVFILGAVLVRNRFIRLAWFAFSTGGQLLLLSIFFLRGWAG